MKSRFLLLLLFFAVTNLTAQPLRKSVFSVASGYVYGKTTGVKNNSSQFFLWSNYAFSSLDEISAVYKKFSLNNRGISFNEDFLALNATLNFFPFYYSISLGGAAGKFNPSQYIPGKVSSQFYSGKVTFYNHLFFYSVQTEYVSIKWKIREDVYSGSANVTWRPTKYFTVTSGGLISRSSLDTSYYAFSFEIFWQPFDFLNISFGQYFGKHRYFYDSDYMIFYEYPYTEYGARTVYLRFYPLKNLGIILNYEHRNYNFSSTEYYSLSLRYDLVFD